MGVPSLAAVSILLAGSGRYYFYLRPWYQQWPMQHKQAPSHPITRSPELCMLWTQLSEQPGRDSSIDASRSRLTKRRG
eukprot:s4116_g2.t1